jgi:hypothetical protein
MTGRRLAFVAGAALAVAALGALARPLLSALDRPHASGVADMPSTDAVPRTVVDVAVRAAAEAIACPTEAGPPAGGCGRLIVTRTDAYRTNPTAITVLILGTLQTRGARPGPVALRVELSRPAAEWTGTVMLP